MAGDLSKQSQYNLKIKKNYWFAWSVYMCVCVEYGGFVSHSTVPWRRIVPNQLQVGQSNTIYMQLQVWYTQN